MVIGMSDPPSITQPNGSRPTFKVGDTVFIAGDTSSSAWRVVGVTRGGRVMAVHNSATRTFDPDHLCGEPPRLPFLRPGDPVEVRWNIDEMLEWRPAIVLDVEHDQAHYNELTRIAVQYEEWQAPDGEPMIMKHRVGSGVRLRE